ncbi:MAG: rubredoxin [Burkholderiaceae bacterium]|nr:rubredoxin [Burkholderiaceae bacterium]
MTTYQCPECGFKYDESRGNAHEGLKPGTPWLSLPQDYACPSCSVRTRDDFEVVNPPPQGKSA